MQVPPGWWESPPMMISAKPPALLNLIHDMVGKTAGMLPSLQPTVPRPCRVLPSMPDGSQVRTLIWDNGPSLAGRCIPTGQKVPGCPLGIRQDGPCPAAGRAAPLHRPFTPSFSQAAKRVSAIFQCSGQNKGWDKLPELSFRLLPSPATVRIQEAMICRMSPPALHLPLFPPHAAAVEDASSCIPLWLQRISTLPWPY